MGLEGTRRVVMTAGSEGQHDAGLVGGRGGDERGGRGNRAGTGSASVTVHGSSMGLVAYTGRDGRGRRDARRRSGSRRRR